MSNCELVFTSVHLEKPKETDQLEEKVKRTVTRPLKVEFSFKKQTFKGDVAKTPKVAEILQYTNPLPYFTKL